MKCLYKYPQAAFPYTQLLEENRRRGRGDREFELLDTGVFAEKRYFDVFVEYAKAAPEDILIRVEVFNRGPEAAALHVLPTVWFRTRWSGGYTDERPELHCGSGGIELDEPYYGRRYLFAHGDPEMLFTENETNAQRLWGLGSATPYYKDGIGEYIVHGNHGAVNPEKRGTKAAAHYFDDHRPGQVGGLRTAAQRMRKWLSRSTHRSTRSWSAAAMTPTISMLV